MVLRCSADDVANRRQVALDVVQVTDAARQLRIDFQPSASLLDRHLVYPRFCQQGISLRQVRAPGAALVDNWQ
jgi:hypothetical protein